MIFFLTINIYNNKIIIFYIFITESYIIIRDYRINIFFTFKAKLLIVKIILIRWLDIIFHIKIYIVDFKFK